MVKNNAKRNTIGDVSKRKVKFSVNCWTMTAPVSNKKRKTVKRRNSWPPDSPRKLNNKKKYEQRFKGRDFPEPFWTDTYEWLVMNCSPECVRPVPLARLTEFDDLITVRSLLPQSSLPYASCVATLSQSTGKATSKITPKRSKPPDTVGFYFIKDKRKVASSDPKQYLRRLKERCLFENQQPLIVPDLNPTNFSNVMLENPLLVPHTDDWTHVQSVPLASTEARVNLDEVTAGKYVTSFANDISDQFQHYPSPSVLPRSSLRPLQSENFEVLGDVVGYSTSSAIHGSSVHIKSKAPIKEIVWNKENIKSSNVGFPDTKFPNLIEKPKHSMGGNNKKEPKSNSFPAGTKLCSPERNLSAFGISSERRFNKLPRSITDKNRDLPRYAPQDMPDPNVEKSGSSKAVASKPSHSQQEVTSSSTNVSQASESSRSPGTSSAPNPGQSSRPYLRQLFEKDIQSNFSKSNVRSKDLTTEEDETKKGKKEVPSKKVSKSEDSPIPAEVVGYSFLQSLRERVDYEEPVKEAAFPASVIGQAFLSALLEQQNKPAENSQEKVIPASVIGQAFLKNLTMDPNSSLQGGSESESKDYLIPSSVVGQAFLKTLVDSSQEIVDQEQSKPIPSSVVSQAFLKSLVEQSPVVKEDSKPRVPSPIPSNVIGQCFVKNLIEQSGVEGSSDKEIVQEEVTPGPIPATVLGQSFLKSLLQEASPPEDPKKEAIPAPVVGQAFLKSLLSCQTQATDDESLGSKPIPSSVLGQTFLKTLIESSSSESEKNESSEPVLPATVIGQKFLKALVEESCIPKDDSSTKQTNESTVPPIPAPVISQTFLKSLIASQPEADTKKTADIPAAVVGSAFLKTLVEEGKMSSLENPSEPIPSAVVGQAFLKSLAQHDMSSQEPVPSPIPSSVVGQAFLKSLVEQSSPAPEPTPNPIPSAVVGQTFLKSLLEQAPAKGQESDSKAIPSSVVGQVFLKSLIGEESKTEEKEEKAIPATVLGQSFLKSLLEQSESDQSGDGKPSRASESKVIPSPVLSQAFLKSLIQEQSSQPSQVSSGPSTSIPASVIGSAFLKALADNQTAEGVAKSEPNSPEASSEPAMPANVIGQAFLKTLLTMSSGSDSPPVVEPQSSSAFPLGSADQIARSAHDSGDNTNGNFSNGVQTTEAQLVDPSGFIPGSEDVDSIIPPPPEFSGSDAVGASRNEVASEIIGELLSYTRMMHSVIESMQDSFGGHSDPPKK